MSLSLSLHELTVPRSLTFSIIIVATFVLSWQKLGTNYCARVCVLLYRYLNRHYENHLGVGEKKNPPIYYHVLFVFAPFSALNCVLSVEYLGVEGGSGGCVWLGKGRV